MIILLLGGIGSGKTISAVKEIITNKDHFAVTNFELNLPKEKYYRLKLSDILNEKETLDKKKKYLTINWDFWESVRKKHKHFSIYLDEVHNIIHSRTSMSKRNVLMSKWISQIRKILSDNRYNHIYLISQTIRKIDVDFRELAQIIIRCRKIKKNKKVYIVRDYFNGIDAFYSNHRAARTVFISNKFFKYYNTNEMVKFKDADIYV